MWFALILIDVLMNFDLKKDKPRNKSTIFNTLIMKIVDKDKTNQTQITGN